MNITWVVKRTDTFLESLRTIKKNKKALEELDKKIKRLQDKRTHCTLVVGFPVSYMARRQHE